MDLPSVQGLTEQAPLESHEQSPPRTTSVVSDGHRHTNIRQKESGCDICDKGEGRPRVVWDEARAEGLAKSPSPEFACGYLDGLSGHKVEAEGLPYSSGVPVGGKEDVAVGLRP
ncbi:hypothetical protein NL676_029887 [Syzygium grande]|nr:hypothetical protein NL676_029887 [Syzygium grande]